MLDGVSPVVQEAYSRSNYSYPNSQQQLDEHELSSLILFVESLRPYQVIEQLEFTICVNWQYHMGSHLALC